MPRPDRAKFIDCSRGSAFDDGVHDVLRELEAESTRRLSLHDRALPHVFRHAVGHWKGGAVGLRARMARGPRIAMARFVEVAGPGLSIVNMLAVARPSLAVPVLGIEIVRLHGRDTLVVADLSPVQADPARPVARRHDGPQGWGQSLPLPPWFRAIGSPDAAMMRIGERELPRAAAMLQGLLGEFAGRVAEGREEPERAASVTAAVDRYAAIHRSEDRGLGLLAKMFGPGWARFFVHHVLFPSSRGMFRANMSTVATRIGDPWTPRPT